MRRWRKIYIAGLLAILLSGGLGVFPRIDNFLVQAQSTPLTLKELYFPEIPQQGEITAENSVIDKKFASEEYELPVKINRIEINSFQKKPHCISTPFEAPGQIIWNTGLTTGGIVIGKNIGSVPDIQTIFGVQKKDVQLLYGNSTTDIYVIDRFDGIKILASKNNGPYEVTISHGDLVFNHIRYVLKSAGYAESRDTFSNMYSKIILHRLKLKADDKDLIYSDQVINLINDINRNSILNMSFAVFPCEPFYLFKQMSKYWAGKKNIKYTLNDFIRDVERISRRKGVNVNSSQIAELMTTPPQDKFSAWIRKNVPSKAYAVASSGNYGPGPQMWPAKSPNVIGVGGLIGNTGNFADWSSPGDVYSMGEWFYSADMNFDYRGTSFAAPSVTALLAIRLTKGKCFSTSSMGRTGYLPLDKLTSGGGRIFKGSLATGATCP